MTVTDNFNKIRAALPPAVTLVAVTKTKPVALLQEAYDAGSRDFGENRVQEMAEKQPQLPADLRWHQIGHLQTNKVKYIAPFVYLIHAVDSLKLLDEINRQAAKYQRVINCLLQIYIADEDTKFGLLPDEARALLNDPVFAAMPNVCVTGLMGLATNTDNTAQVRQEFRSLKTVYDELAVIRRVNVQFDTLSMGMSGDYQIAVDEGSTMVRVGSAIFGTR